MWYFKTKLIAPHYVLTTSDHRYVTDPHMWSPEKGPPLLPQKVNHRRFGKFAHSFMLLFPNNQKVFRENYHVLMLNKQTSQTTHITYFKV
jgi:hypothetical protein